LPLESQRYVDGSMRVLINFWFDTYPVLSKFDKTPNNIFSRND